MFVQWNNKSNLFYKQPSVRKFNIPLFKMKKNVLLKAYEVVQGDVIWKC